MKRKHQGGGEHIPNLAPMVDVIMVLLIFFLLGASVQLSKEGVLQTELDPSSGPGAGQRVQIVPLVQIHLAAVGDGSDCVISVNDETVTAANPFDELGRLMARRRAAGADVANPVVVGADMQVRWKFVVRAMDAAIRAGFKNVQFAVSSGGTPGS